MNNKFVIVFLYILHIPIYFYKFVPFPKTVFNLNTVCYDTDVKRVDHYFLLYNHFVNIFSIDEHVG